MIIFCVWLGMLMVSGVSKKHLFMMIAVIVISLTILWSFGFKEYQKDRIRTFIDPLADISGAGYNAYQSTVAIGSGQFLGKGVGYGTESRLKFLPEYQTDFIFAAFAEEWGFVGALAIIFLFGFAIWRVLKNAFNGQGNFERFFGIGLSVFLASHAVIHIGMNIGLLPITGIPLPFVSYGGANLLTVFAGLGILMGMRSYGINVPDDPHLI